MGASVEILEGENERYAATLVFLHGLWVGPEVWRPVAHGFAHRGWRCALVDARAGCTADERFGGWCAMVREAVAEMEEPAVLLGHDAGGLVALALGGAEGVSAVVAVAPLVEGAASLVDARTRLRTRLGLGAAEPPSRAHPYRELPTSSTRSLLTRALAPEPARRVASLYRSAPVVGRGSGGGPILLVGQAADAVVPSASVEKAARTMAADFLALPGSHWPMLEPGPDPWLSAIHRWLIRRLGPSLLRLRGDEDLAGD